MNELLFATWKATEFLYVHDLLSVLIVLKREKLVDCSTVLSARDYVIVIVVSLRTH